MKDLIGKEVKVLDHGFVRVVDVMGDDAAICQAARVSYGKGTRSVNEDRGLIRYLMRHWHSTPFEMCEIKLHVKLPIFVARQWIRHRTANVNEYSARYSILDREFYVPDPEHIAGQSKVNNQGRGDVFAHDKALDLRSQIDGHSGSCFDFYEALLNNGLARELSRMVLPTNAYTQWYWKIDLHNLFHFLMLRADEHAQYEIRAYAQVILDEIVKPWVPLAHEAFVDYRLEAETFSRMELEWLRELVKWTNFAADPSGLSERELREFRQKLGLG